MGRNDFCVTAEVAGMVVMALAAVPAISSLGLAGLGAAYLLGRVVCLAWLVWRVGGTLGRAADWIPASPAFLRTCATEIRGLRNTLGGEARDV
jgi:hypothetical protein